MRNQKRIMIQTLENDQNPWFWAILGVSGPIKGRQNFFGGNDHRNQLNVITVNPNMENEKKTNDSNSWKWPKTLILGHFGRVRPNLGPPNFFFKNPVVSLKIVYRKVTWCKKSKKSNGGKYENWRHGRTDGQTDGRTDRRTDGRTDPLIEIRGRI